MLWSVEAKKKPTKKKQQKTQTNNWNPGKTQSPEQNNPSKTSSELFGLCDQQNDTTFNHNVTKSEINQKSLQGSDVSFQTLQ